MVQSAAAQMFMVVHKSIRVNQTLLALMPRVLMEVGVALQALKMQHVTHTRVIQAARAVKVKKKINLLKQEVTSIFLLMSILCYEQKNPTCLLCFVYSLAVDTRPSCTGQHTTFSKQPNTETHPKPPNPCGHLGEIVSLSSQHHPCR